MKAKVIFLALALGASTGLRAAQDGNPSRDAQRPAPPAGGPGVPAGGDRPGQTETLTDAPQAQVKGILAKYDASTLTADQAKAIHEAFRQASLRGGPALADTLKAAGFDPDKLRNLDAKYTCKGAYLYSRAIDLPPIANTDFLFAQDASSTQQARN